MGAAADVGRVAAVLGGAVFAAAEAVVGTFLTEPEDETFLVAGSGKIVLISAVAGLAALVLVEAAVLVVVAALFTTLALV